MSQTETSSPESRTATVRCPLCLKLNRVDVARAEDRPKCGSCDRPLLLDRPIKVDGDDLKHAGAPEAEQVKSSLPWCRQTMKQTLGRHHPLVRRLRELRRQRARRDAEGAFVAEGLHLADEALSSGAEIESVIVSPRPAATAWPALSSLYSLTTCVVGWIEKQELEPASVYQINPSGSLGLMRSV